MRVRRCQSLLLEPRERRELDVAALLADPPDFVAWMEWIALGAHLDAEVALEPAEVAALGAISPTRWVAYTDAVRMAGDGVVDALLAKGLLVAEDSDEPAAHADAAQRVRHWRPLSAIAHRHSRWRGVDTVAESQRLAELGDGAVHRLLGAPPPPTPERTVAAAAVPLERASPTPLDALLDARVTCRNFDEGRTLALDDVGAVLWRAFGARATIEVTGVPVLKKGVPSAGGLHPTEAYLLVQRVEGLAPGLYHYRCVDHALEPLRDMDGRAVRECARRFVAAQAHFAPAPLMVVMATRFERNFWKYRNHAKAWRATVLDAGHLSQVLYLAATELGLAAFITAAVNEGEIEDAFGLDPMEQGVVAVAGFGHRGPVRDAIELDPLHAVWPPG